MRAELRARMITALGIACLLHPNPPRWALRLLVWACANADRGLE